MPTPTQTARGNLATLVEDMRGWGDAIAVVEHRGVRRYPTRYGELAALSRRFAAELERRGIRPGERVVVWGENGAGWIAAFFGCVLAGVLPVPLDATGSVEFAERIVREVSPRLVVGDGALLARLDLGRGQMGGQPGGPDRLPLETLAAALPGGPGRLNRPELTPGSPLQILFTSGTTGEPKGVVHTHGNLLASLSPIEREIAKYRRYERWVHPLRFLHTLPLSHVFGQFMGLWVPPLLGATVHYESRVTGSRLAELIPGERVHVLAAVPRTLGLLRGHLLGRDAALAGEIEAARGEPVARRWWRFRRVHRALGLRFWAAVCGGATLPEELERFWTTLGFAVVQGYGLTETAALVTLNHPFQTARGSLGKPLPGRELRLGLHGELEVKGAMVAGSSWQGGRMVTREGPWLSTGDLASFDEHGRVQFLGRTGQRLVTSAGLNVYLQDVEQALEGQPELRGAVVLALPDEGGGEEPAAVVVGSGAEAAVARANGSLAAHQQVRRWWVWPGLELPRTATGKVRRKAVENWAREQARNGAERRDGGGSDAGDSAAPLDPLVALLESVGARRGPLGNAARLEEDWGLDSMGRVALTAALEEQLGVALGDREAAGLRTLGDLRALGSTRSREEPGAQPLPPAPRQLGLESAAGDGAQWRLKQSRAGVGAGVWAPREPEASPRYGYPTWPWTAPAAAVRVLFIELIVRPLVWILAAPRVLSALRGAPAVEPTSQKRDMEHPQKRPAGSPKQALRFAQDDSAPSPGSSSTAARMPSAIPRSGTRGPMLLISNHRTAMDVPLLLYALPFRVRSRVAVAMSGEMLAGWQQSWSLGRLPAALAEHRRWWGPPAAMLLKALLNVFPLPRTSGFRGSFAHAGRALDRGYHVLIFPEGRRSPGESMGRFKPGLGILAREAYVPVLPLGLSIAGGSRRRWFRSRPGVHVGAPVGTDPWNGWDLSQEPEEITERLRAAVEALLRHGC